MICFCLSAAFVVYLNQICLTNVFPDQILLTSCKASLGTFSALASWLLLAHIYKRRMPEI